MGYLVIGVTYMVIGLDNSPTTQGTVYLANGASTLWALPAGTLLYVQKAQISTMGSVEG